MGKKTTTQTVQADPSLRSRGLSLFDAASGYQMPTSSYGSGAGFMDRMMNAGRRMVGAEGMGAYGAGPGAVGFELTPDEIAAREGIRGMTDIPSIFAGNIGTYMNPYINDVIGQNTADLDRARQLANLDAASLATRQGAFGGDRAALLEAENNRNFLDSVARSSAQLRSSGFDMASRNLFQGLGMQGNAYGQLAGLGAQERMIPMQYYDFLSGLLQGIPGNTTGTSTEKGNWVTGLTGLLAAGAGAYRQASGMGG